MANNMLLLFRIFTQRIVLNIFFICCLLLAIASFRSLPPKTPLFAPETTEPLKTASPPKPGIIEIGAHCSVFPNSPDVQIIVKTGANEIYEKLPTQLLTSLQCYNQEDILFFSDLEQEMGPLHIHDALANVTEAVKATPHFDYYRTLQSLRKDRQDVSRIKQAANIAWDLDKFKFLHMLEETWRLRPGLKWYVFIEADTYLIRSNLLLWLQRLDSSHPLYLGSSSYAGDELFGHGGSGIILSAAALSTFADGDPGVATRYDERMKDERYGDVALARALREKGVRLNARWPMLQGEKPSSIPFGPGPDSGTRHWCQPIVTMHHINPDEATRLWEFEQKRPDHKKPLLIHEIYQELISPYIQAERDNWDNISDDVFYRAPSVQGNRQKDPQDMSAVEKEAYMSFEHCKKACEEQSSCHQFLYQDTDKECSFAYSFRLGGKRASASGVNYKSGWPLERIARFEASNVCEVAQWL